MKPFKNRERYILSAIILLLLLFIGYRYYDYRIRQSQEELLPESSVYSDEEIIPIDKNEEEETPFIYIHVSGKVKHPGLVKLKSGARTIDAIEAAGGPLSEGNLDAVNLAKILQDEDKIHIPSREETSAVLNASPGTDMEYLIDINQGTEVELTQIPGIGPKTAQKIIKYREDHPFKRIEDLMNVEGIGEKKFNQLKDYIICQ